MANQMQSRMDDLMTGIRLESALKLVQVQMLAAAERIEKRPALKGCDALKRTQSHTLVQNSKDAGPSIMVSAAIGTPGLTDTADAAMDAAEQLYSDGKTGRARVQDRRELTPKQEAQYRDDNKNDLALFLNLENKMLALQAFASCGVTHVDILNSRDEIRPSGLVPKDPVLKPKLSEKDHEELAQSLSFRQGGPKPSGMRMGA